MMDEGQDQALASFPVELGVLGQGSEFRTQNTSQDDWERRNIIERTQDAVYVYCDLMDVRHGTLGSASDGELATLMVFRFRFDPQKKSRRVFRAIVKIDFLATKKGEEAPEVCAIAPEERWSLATTTDHEKIVTGIELGLSAGGLPVTPTGSFKREKKTTRDVNNATTVSGSINLGSGLNSGRETVARWLLLENDAHPRGVPDSLTASVILKRDTDDPFNAIVTIEANADLATSFGSLFRKEPLDDPVLFNPRAELKHIANKRRTRNVENLGAVELYELCDSRIMGRRYCFSTKLEPERA